MLDLVCPPGKDDARLGAGVVEEAELDPGAVLGEEREVRPLAVPVRAERERAAGPRKRWAILVEHGG